MKKPRKAASSESSTSASNRYSKGWATRRKNAAARKRQRTRERQQGKTYATANTPSRELMEHQANVNAELKSAMTQAGLAQMMGTGRVSPEAAVQHGAPGKGEIVGGRISSLVEEIASIIRQKGGKDTVQTMVQQHIELARLEGANDTEARLRRMMKNQREQQAKRIICGFLAEIRIAEQLHRNTGLPDGLVFNIPSVTVVKIVDALNKAGYRHDGYRDPNSDGEAVTDRSF